MHHRSLPLLTFFGTASFLVGDERIELRLKYQKGTALLACLSSQPDKVFRREWLAALFWPDLEIGSGRANLRLVLADVQSVLKQLGYPGLLDARRDWLVFQPKGVLLTDGCALALAVNSQGEFADVPPPSREWVHWLRLRRKEVWLGDSATGFSSDFDAWLQAQRRLLSDTNEAVGSAAFDTHSHHSPVHAVLPLTRLSRLHPLSIVRVDLDARKPTGTMRDDENLADVEACLSAMDFEAGALGGHRLAHDEGGCLYVFGMNSTHMGYRANALRFCNGVPGLVGQSHQARIGLTCGMVLVSQNLSTTISGWRLRLANWLATSCEPGQVLCDQSFQDLARAMQFESLGESYFGGVTHPLNLFRKSMGIPGHMSLPLLGGCQHELVGRDLEMALCTSMAESARLHSLALCLVGPSGMGKSRVALDFSAHHVRDGGCVFWLSGQPATHHTPWSAIRAMLVRALPNVELSAASTLEVDRLLDRSPVAPIERASMMALLLELLQGTPDAPTLVMIDDCRWMDPSTLNLLAQLAPSVRHVFWLVTHQSHGHTSLPDASGAEDSPLLAALPNLRTCVLAPLTDSQCLSLLQQTHTDADSKADVLVPDPAVSQEVRRKIQDSRGLPLYLLCDSDGIGSCGYFDSHCHALLNRLGDGREVFELAAVLGMLFSANDLQPACGSGTVSSAMVQGVSNQVAVDRGGQQFAFFHPALVTFLIKTQPVVTFSANCRRAAAVLGGSGEHAKAAALWETAFEQDAARASWAQAATQALAADDLELACGHFEQLERMGFAPLDTLALGVVDLQLAHAGALAACKGFGYEKVWCIAQCILDDEARNPLTENQMFHAQALIYMGAGGPGRPSGLDQAGHLVSMANSPLQRFAASWAMGNSLFWQGEFMKASEWLSRCMGLSVSLSRADRSRFFGSDVAVFGCLKMAWGGWLLGEAAVVSAEWTGRASALLESSGRRHDICLFHSMTALLRWSQGETLATRVRHQRC